MIKNDEQESSPSELRLGGEEIITAVADYIAACRNEVLGKNKQRFPNLAGFCRHLGIGIEVLEEALKDDPRIYGVICAVFEDEALNSELSPTVVTTYLKQRLGYGEKVEPKRAALELPEVKLVFDHDIFEDGG